jgi:2-polyprenyl-3-methyl-5-hydroxy-6-metoxy-1,4-benzoquinol methylase
MHLLRDQQQQMSNNQPIDEISTTTFFSADSDRFAENYGSKPSFRDRLQLFGEAVRKASRAPARVLDFGCGPGVISASVARMGYDVTAIDGSLGMVEKARKVVSDQGLSNLQFEVVEASKFRLESEIFDVIICSSVIEYLPNDLAVLSRLVDALKSGGTLIVSAPNAWSTIGLIERAVRTSRQTFGLRIGRHFDHSLRHYSRFRLKIELQRLGLRVDRVTNFEFPWLGTLGVTWSRSSLFGAMMMFEANKLS